VAGEGTVSTKRFVIDAMNVIGSRPTGWWRDRDGAARRLVERLQRYVAASGDEVTVVIDGRPVRGLPEGEQAGVRVLYARRPGRNAADDRIVEVVADDGRPESLQVVTSDRELGVRVRALGASTSGATGFLRRLDRLDSGR
jgi:predicted RNA-binding protein with PIN domain